MRSCAHFQAHQSDSCDTTLASFWGAHGRVEPDSTASLNSSMLHRYSSSSGPRILFRYDRASAKAGFSSSSVRTTTVDVRPPEYTSSLCPCSRLYDMMCTSNAENPSSVKTYALWGACRRIVTTMSAASLMSNPSSVTRHAYVRGVYFFTEHRVMAASGHATSSASTTSRDAGLYPCNSPFRSNGLHRLMTARWRAVVPSLGHTKLASRARSWHSRNTKSHWHRRAKS